jgi:hypothetical protein
LLCAAAIFFAAIPAQADLMETWELPMAAANPFNGTGDLVWTGDLAAWAMTTATWPVSPAQDFAGVRSLRTTHHGSTADPALSVVETVVTDISSELDLAQQMEWQVFFSGSSVSIQPSRRADFILLSDVSDPSVIEDPNELLNGFKLTLWDPYFDDVDNIPSSSHEGAAIMDALTLWSVDDTDDRWRVVGSIPLDDPNLNEGWNLRVLLDTDGSWFVGYATGAIGQTPGLSLLGVAAPNPLNYLAGAYSGVGWGAPTTDSDSTQFGFDNFSVAAVPEPSSVVLALAGCMALLALRRRSDRGVGEIDHGSHGFHG